MKTIIILIIVIFSIEISYSQTTTISNSINEIYGGSTAIILRIKNSIIIAADSKMALLDNATRDAGRINKIKKIKNFAFVNVGIIKDLNKKFDVDQIVESAANKSSDLQEIHQLVVAEICKKLPLLFADIKRSNPENYSYCIKNNHNSASIALVGTMNGKLTIIASHFIATNKSCEHSLVDAPSDEEGVIILGQRGEIDHYLDYYPSPFTQDIEKAMEMLIGLEAKKNPDSVSLPIDILRLDIAGFRWLRYNQY